MSKYKTIAIDSASELARLYFSWDMKKSPTDMEKIRGPSNYPGTTERLNMLVRRLKDYRDAGMEIVITAHEDIQKVYARGGMIAAKGQQPVEPASVKGWPDLPGNRTPDEVCRAADNVFHMRWINGKARWVARREVIVGDAYWEVKDRFGALRISGGVLPANYTELESLAKQHCEGDWSPPYIWVLYGPFGIGKTRCLLSFPRPLLIFDLDKGSASIKKHIKEGDIDVVSYNVENSKHYEPFVTRMEASLK